MHFCCRDFLFFFLAVFFAYWAMPWKRGRVFLLLGASFYFYAYWDARLALLIVASTTVDFFLARGIEAAQTPWRRKLLLTINILGNLGLLCYFKYANFFLESLDKVLSAAGIEHQLHPLKTLMVVGISFYTFEAINYMVDVYRGKVKAEKDLFNFQLFILFFPHLVAGPIVRARDFLPQIRRDRRFSWLRLEVGVRLFLLGLLKKLVIADRMAQIAAPVFQEPEAFRTSACWVAVIAFAIQIYCDFSGYTDMALGCAHMLGYKLTVNFNMPYLAVNVAEFWRRWHISLSTWLRDYLFIPLGGSRGSGWATCRNLMITMTLGGLWHGANWTYILWGVLHGLYLVVHRVFRAFCEARPRLDWLLGTGPGTAFRWGLTLFVVSLTWVVFQDPTKSRPLVLFEHLFSPHPGHRSVLPGLVVGAAIALLAVGHYLGTTGVWKKWLERTPAPLVGWGYSVLLTLILVLAPSQGQTFIYFQF